MHALDHKHFIATAYLDNPPRSEDDMNTWLLELVEKIDMEIFFGPVSKYCDTEGNEGVTGIIGLTTSHASAHCWTHVEKPVVKFDVYSCKDYDIQVVIDHLQCWSPTSVNYIVIDRNDDIIVSDQGDIVF
jgi:S-adenosylmethionine/arginine decarboxylase-like enzyme